MQITTITGHLSEWLSSKRQQITNVDKNVEKGELSCTVSGMQIGPATVDLIDRVPTELWMEVPDIVQETGSKAIPKKKNAKKQKWLSEEALQIVEKRREVKDKEENESYIHLNAEFQ